MINTVQSSTNLNYEEYDKWHGTWTLEEDQKLAEWVDKNGPERWTDCSKTIKGRCGK